MAVNRAYSNYQTYVIPQVGPPPAGRTPTPTVPGTPVPRPGATTTTYAPTPLPTATQEMLDAIIDAPPNSPERRTALQQLEAFERDSLQNIEYYRGRLADERNYVGPDGRTGVDELEERHLDHQALRAWQDQYLQVADKIAAADPSAARTMQQTVWDPNYPRPGEAQQPHHWGPDPRVAAVRIGNQTVPLDRVEASPDAVLSAQNQQANRAQTERHHQDDTRIKEAQLVDADLDRDLRERTLELNRLQTELNTTVQLLANQRAMNQFDLDQQKFTYQQKSDALEADRLALKQIVDTAQSQDLARYQAWMNEQDFDAKTFDTVANLVRSRNDNASREDIARGNALAGQRNTDVEAATTLVNTAFQAYAKSLEKLVDVPGAWWDSFQKLAYAVGAGRSDPKALAEWMAQPGPTPLRPDPRFMNEQLASLLGTTPDKPLPDRYDLADMLRPRVPDPAAPERTEHPGFRIDPAQLAVDPSAILRTPAPTADEAMDSARAHVPELPEIEHSEVLDDVVVPPVDEITTPISQPMDQQVDERTSHVQSYTMPGAHDAEWETIGQQWKPLIPHVYQDEGPRGLALMGTTIGDILAGDDPREALEANWGQIDRHVTLPDDWSPEFDLIGSLGDEDEDEDRWWEVA
jgi:hypothetical protein